MDGRILVNLACLLQLFLSLASSMPVNFNIQDTAESYFMSNCINNHTKAGYAAVFYYYPDFLPDFPEPQAIGYINRNKTVIFEGHTWTVKSPFTLSATIPKEAKEAAVGTTVGPASSSSFAGPMAVVKEDGRMFYSPQKHVYCYVEYRIRDVLIRNGPNLIFQDANSNRMRSLQDKAQL